MDPFDVILGIFEFAVKVKLYVEFHLTLYVDTSKDINGDHPGALRKYS